MSERTLKQLVGALVIALAVWAVVLLVSGGSDAISASGEIVAFFEDIDAGSLEAVRIVRSDSTISLEREAGGWAVNGFPTDSAAVRRLLEELEGMEVGDLMATNPTNHARMGVSADSAVTVELGVANGARSILVGKAGRRFGTSYARLPGQDEVYLLEGDLRSHVGRGLEQWRNRTMVAIDSSAVTRLEVEKDGESYTLVRGDTAWVFDGGGPASAMAVSGILSELSRLVASGFVAETDSVARLPRSSTTSAYGHGGELLAEITIGEGTGDRWARTSTDDYLYRVSAFRANRVAPARADAEPASGS